MANRDPRRTMTPDTQQYEYFASCAQGAEKTLAAELTALGAGRVRPLQAQVAFFGSLEVGYRACLWTRTASRVFLVLGRLPASDAEELYESVKALPWEDHIDPASTIAVAAHGTNPRLIDTRFIALKVKDAVCDRLRDISGSRPSVARTRPSVRIDFSLRETRATISLDLAGEPLHMRGYRVPSPHIVAPLRETLAATMLLAAGWSATATGQSPVAAACIAEQDSAGFAKQDIADAFNKPSVFLDPLCGSGTIAIEAALIAYDHAPGALRDYWGFAGWLGHDEKLWASLLDEADARAEAASEFYHQGGEIPLLFASDVDPSAVAVAQASARRAGVERFIHFSVADITQSRDIIGADPARRALIVTNPPYGKRLSTTSQLPSLYAALRVFIDPAFSANPDDLCVITSDEALEAYLGRAPSKRIAAFNGPFEADIMVFSALDSHGSALSADPRDIEQFENRLAKMAIHRAKWARRNSITCYRVYDADLPSFAVAIDIYQSAGRDTTRWLHIAEYAPPKHIDPALAMQRLAAVLNSAPRILDIPLDCVYLKTRQRAKGGSQYAQYTQLDEDNKESSKSDHTKKSNEDLSPVQSSKAYEIIGEGGLLFEVDFTSHLDTGIFLDHRQTRALLKEAAKDKDVLNLFAYTGTASVYMAAGGAKTVTNIDLSKTYLSVAKRNMERNGFVGQRYNFVQADVLRWVKDNRHGTQKYGLIFCDAPTFSNSSSMGSRTWDVQRDHAELLIALTRMLIPGGLIVFSTNLRDFVPDEDVLQRAGVTISDISAQTIPPDFERNQKIHHCYYVQRVQGQPPRVQGQAPRSHNKPPRVQGQPPRVQGQAPRSLGKTT